MTDSIKQLINAGYPYKIRGNGGYEAVLVGQEIDCGIYRYPRGECVHDLLSIKLCFEVIQQYPED